MSEEKKSERLKSELGWTNWWLGFIALACVVVLALVPMLQYGVIYLFTGPDGFKSYLASNSPPIGFYQFVLTAMSVLAAIAGYLTYKSREEAKQEVEKIREEMKEQKKEVDKFCEEMKIKLDEREASFNKRAKEIDNLMKQCEERITTAVGGVERKGEEATGSIVHLVNQFKQKADEQMGFISSVQPPASGETEKEKEAREIYNKGKEAFADRNWEMAMKLSTNAIAINRNFTDAYLLRGMARSISGDLELAITDFDLAIAIKPTDEDAYWFRSHVRFAKGDIPGALADCNKAISLNPNNERAYYDRACARARLKEVDLCAADLRKAIGLDKKYLQMAREDKDFDGVRDEAAIVEILGKPPYGG
jgi:tetratricopeptide (TPR) repeat protein